MEAAGEGILDQQRLEAAVEAGADEYVMKPFDRETLESKLQIVGVAVLVAGFTLDLTAPFALPGRGR